jgi:DNA-binding NtrC family response regulator
MSARILVVDDESDMETLFRQQFRRDLKAGRFCMQFATSAQQALGMIEDTGGANIVLLLTDINMPGMSGLDLLPRAKAARPDLPVIMVTAYGDANTRRRALESGAEDLLPKPIDFAALRAEVDRRLAGRMSGP